ncbi:MAG: hypothetical protein FWG98_05075 [Candidatus Cloacimonetes bacterium]|nr:hypothetical protein [Candidatus Cloacimonadota bacterium]
MNRTGQLAIKPIKFTCPEYIGIDGTNFFNIDYSLAKLLTQNILYSAYREPLSISEIAKLLSTHRTVIEEDIDFLVKNGFMLNISADNYLTNILLHDLSFEAQEKLHKIYSKVAKDICDKYVPALFDIGKELFRSLDLIIPNNDFNFWLWSVIAFACSRKHIIPDLYQQIEKFFVSRKDGGHNLVYATVLKKHKFNFNFDLYQSYGDRDFTIGASEMYPFRIWLYNTYYSNRPDGKIASAFAGFPELYDFINNRLENDPDKDECIERLLSNGLIVKALENNKNDYDINAIAIKMSLNDFSDLLPAMPNEFIDINHELDRHIYDLCKTQYPPQMQDLFHVFCKNTINSCGVKTRVLELLLQKGVLKPLTANQKRTVNMLMFLD